MKKIDASVLVMSLAMLVLAIALPCRSDAAEPPPPSPDRDRHRDDFLPWLGPWPPPIDDVAEADAPRAGSVAVRVRVPCAIEGEALRLLDFTIKDDAGFVASGGRVLLSACTTTRAPIRFDVPEGGSIAVSARVDTSSAAAWETDVATCASSSKAPPSIATRRIALARELVKDELGPFSPIVLDRIRARTALVRRSLPSGSLTSVSCGKTMCRVSVAAIDEKRTIDEATKALVRATAPVTFDYARASNGSEGLLVVTFGAAAEPR